MIWVTSIWKLGCSNRSKIHSAQKCYLCLRYVVSPMSPGWTQTDWRRRRDSNPRDPFGSNGFQDRRFQPLTHSSICNSNRSFDLERICDNLRFLLLQRSATVTELSRTLANFATAALFDSRFVCV